ncbi:MAG: DUF1338 domain-containing protein [Myxococcota bacterium]
MDALDDLSSLFARLWRSYVGLCPSAPRVRALLGGEAVVNDHVAYRTYDHPRLGIAQLAAPFVAAGYTPRGDYVFEAKKVRATHFERGPGDPKIFLSELVLGDCSPALRRIVHALAEAVPAGGFGDPLDAGRPWTLAHGTYEALRSESEYAAWVAVHGLRVNHFTARVNALPGSPTLAEVVRRLEDAGVELSDAGGVIKGSPAVGLAQASTRADRVRVALAEGEHEVPGAYYELAERHPGPEGPLYEGFVTASADRIFESTAAR